MSSQGALSDGDGPAPDFQPRRTPSEPVSEPGSGLGTDATGSVSGADNSDSLREKEEDGAAEGKVGRSSLSRRDGSVSDEEAAAAFPTALPLSHRDDDDDGRGPSDAAGEEAAAAAAAAPEAGRTRLQTLVVVTALASALFLAALDVTIVTVAIPAIAHDFDSTMGYTWIGSAYLLANAATAPSWGKVSDIWGRKQILLAAAAVFWLGSLLCAVSASMPMLVAGRAVQGTGGGGIITLVNICISDLFSLRRRGVYFGAMGLIWALAGGVGPVLGGVFTQKATWRWCFWVNLPVAGVGIVVLSLVLKLHNPRTPVLQGLRAVDWLGSLAVIAGTAMVLLALTMGGVVLPWSSATVLCLLVVGLAVVAVFVVVETRVAVHPLMPMRLFATRSNAAAFAASSCQAFAFVSGSYYLPLYFQSVVAADPLMSGVYVLPYMVSLSLVAVATGCYTKGTGRYLPPVFFGFAVMTLGFGLFVDLPGPAPPGRQPQWAKIVLYQLVAGVGVGPNFQSPLLALQATAAPADMASVTAAFQFVRQLSTSISVVVGGVVFQNGMAARAPGLASVLGPDVAALLGGEEAAASVGVVADIPGERGLLARAAFAESLRTMWIVYVCASGLGLVVSCFIGSRVLSRDHEEHKTGLKSLVRARSNASAPAPDPDATAVGGREGETAWAIPEPEARGRRRSSGGLDEGTADEKEILGR